MAAVGPTRQSRVSMSLVQGGAAASGAGTVLGMLQTTSLTSTNVNGFFISVDSCCRSILSGAQHPARCSTGSPDWLWSFWCCLVSFTFHFTSICIVAKSRFWISIQVPTNSMLFGNFASSKTAQLLLIIWGNSFKRTRCKKFSSMKMKKVLGK